MRTEFKKVKLKDQSYLYPTPVIKEQKYLISVEEKFADFFIASWHYGLLLSPDEKVNYLIFLRLHTDKKTSIFNIDYDKLSFRFLGEGEGKAKKIQDVITTKITSYLQGQQGSQEALKKAFSNQMKCKTCIDLGILRPEVTTWISHLIDV